MTPNPFQSLLDQIEDQLGQCTQAMIGKTQDLPAASEALLASMVTFSKLLKPAEIAARRDPVLKQRLHRIAGLLASYRSSLLRQSGLVERGSRSTGPGEPIPNLHPIVWRLWPTPLRKCGSSKW